MEAKFKITLDIDPDIDIQEIVDELQFILDKSGFDCEVEELN